MWDIVLIIVILLLVLYAISTCKLQCNSILEGYSANYGCKAIPANVLAQNYCNLIMQPKGCANCYPNETCMARYSGPCEYLDGSEGSCINGGLCCPSFNPSLTTVKPPKPQWYHFCNDYTLNNQN